MYYCLKLKSLTNSNKLKEKARKLYPAMTGTFSRTASSFVEGVYPVYANSANGAYFKDVDDNDYDFEYRGGGDGGNDDTM